MRTAIANYVTWRARRLSAGQAKLLLFLADHGEPPRRVHYATYDALIMGGLVYREGRRDACKPTELGNEVAEVLLDDTEQLAPRAAALR